MKKRNKILLIILIVFIVIAVVLGIFAYKNRNTISTMYYVLTGQTEQLEKDKIETDKRAKEAVKEFGIETLNPLSEEETEKLKNGELSQEEAIDIVLGRNEESAEEKEGQFSSETGKEPTNPGKEPANTGKTSSSGSKESSKGDDVGSKAEETKPAQSDEYKQKNDEISRLIGELYVLKSEFSSDLSVIEDWVIDKYCEYTLQYGEGNIPSSIKMKIGKKAYADALALEDECDIKVYAILDKIEVLLKETGQSTKLVDEMKSAYDSEKRSAISYYMSRF